MTKKLLLIAIIALFSSTVKAQEKEVEIKDDKVLLDGSAILKYEKISLYEHSIYSLDDDEIISYRYSDNETPKIFEDDYFVLNFLPQKVKVESTSVTHTIAGLGLNSRKNMQKLIKWLIKEKIINTDGSINNDKVENFHQKYNEDIVRRTVR
jgi:hypothetical protein